MNELGRLHREHVSLGAIAGKLSEMIKRDVPPPAQQLYAIRMRLASELIRHLKTEDWILYPRLLASSDRHTAETSRVFSNEMGGLAEAFGNYVDRWVAFEIESDWKGYRRDTAKILGILARRISREERELYPLLESAAQLTA